MSQHSKEEALVHREARSKDLDTKSWADGSHGKTDDHLPKLFDFGPYPPNVRIGVLLGNGGVVLVDETTKTTRGSFVPQNKLKGHLWS